MKNTGFGSMARCIRSTSGHRTPGDALLMLGMELSVQSSQGQSRNPVEIKHRDSEAQGVVEDLPDSFTPKWALKSEETEAWLHGWG